VAAKHDNKHARANMWVTHQNLAAQKGGRPGYQFKERKAPIVAKRPAPAPKPAEAVPAAPGTTEETSA
jgi:hypothetical protein